MDGWMDKSFFPIVVFFCLKVYVQLLLDHRAYRLNIFSAALP